MIVMLIGCGEMMESEGRVTLEETVAGVHVDIGTGSVRVSGDETITSPRFRWRKQWIGEEPTLEHSVDGDQLLITSHEEGLFASIDLDLDVPLGTVVVADLGTGDFTGRTLADLTIDIGTGDALVEDVGGPFTASLGTGDLDGTGLGGVVLSDVGTGDTRLSTVVPVDVQADSGTGDIDLEVPTGTYRLTTDVGTGDVNVNGVQDGEEGPVLFLSTGTGDLRVTGI
jgi:hypothetical protein